MWLMYGGKVTALLFSTSNLRLGVFTKIFFSLGTAVSFLRVRVGVRGGSRTGLTVLCFM